MYPHGLPPRCNECGQSLSGAPNSYRTLAEENRDLRERVNLLLEEVSQLNGGGFVSSEIAPHYHRRNCPWADELNQKYLIEYHSCEEAERSGKTQCGVCLPRNPRSPQA